MPARRESHRDAKGQLVGFLDRRVFDRILRASPARRSEADRKALGVSEEREQRTRHRRHRPHPQHEKSPHARAKARHELEEIRTRDRARRAKRRSAK